MKALLLSAYHARSHAYWCEQVRALSPSVSWTELSLPPRHFNWRIRGNSLSWGLGERKQLSQPYDFLIATSMVDLSSLRGFVPELTALPTLLYFHENQFAYPLSPQGRPAIEAQLVPIYSALCADILAFNSNFNRSEFLAGASKLLAAFPDHVPRDIEQRLAKAITLPVPIAAPLTGFSETTLASTSENRVCAVTGSSLLDVVWNHRWEYDKGPTLLLEIVQRIIARELPVRLHIVGQQFRQAPVEFSRIAELNADYAEKMGFEQGAFGHVADQRDYEQLLGQADVALSTADHDFQGLALQEAIRHGCTPLAPARLVYPEYVRPDCLYADAGQLHGASRYAAEADSAVSKLEQWCVAREHATELPKQNLAGYTAEALGPQYRQIFKELIETSSSIRD